MPAIMKEEELHDNVVIHHAEPELIERTTTQLIQQLRKDWRNVLQHTTNDNASFKSVLVPLAHAENAFLAGAYSIYFCAASSPDPAVRNASREARTLLEAFVVECFQDEAMFQRISIVKRQQESLSLEHGRFLEHKYNQFTRNGMLLPTEDRERLRKIKHLIGEKTATFHANLQNSSAPIWISRSDLQGVPEHVLAKFEADPEHSAGQLRVTLDAASYGAIMRFAKKDKVRRQVFLAYENRCAENDALFHDVVVLRDQGARLLGYASHASLQLVDKMAGTPELVNSFLRDLQTELAEPGRQEMQRLVRLKREDTTALDRVQDEKYYLWDHAYYHRLSMEQIHQVDHARLSEYFPLQTVLERMLSIFQGLFGLKFTEIARGHEQSSRSWAGDSATIRPWHEDVRCYTVQDTDDSDAFLGYLYMDLHARPGKDGGPVNHTIIPGFTRPDGRRQYPSSALLCSFSKPSPTEPTLLRHDEVWTLFHELGHGIHDIVSKTAYACFHGTAVPVDFGEAPSQMLEYWCWLPTTIKFLSQHYSYISDEYRDSWMHSMRSTRGNGAEMTLPSEVMPDEMITTLIATKHVNGALFHLNQLRFGLFDMAVHHPRDHQAIQEMNLSATFNDIRSQVYPPRGPEDLGQDNLWGHGHTLCGHLMSEDYSAGYYSYLFSKVFAADMFYSVFKSDPMSSTEGRRYRYAVLEKGGSRDAMEMMTEFLRRPPDSRAFKSELSLAT